MLLKREFDQSYKDLKTGGKKFIESVELTFVLRDIPKLSTIELQVEENNENRIIIIGEYLETNKNLEPYVDQINYSEFVEFKNKNKLVYNKFIVLNGDNSGKLLKEYTKLWANGIKKPIVLKKQDRKISIIEDLIHLKVIHINKRSIALKIANKLEQLNYDRINWYYNAIMEYLNDGKYKTFIKKIYLKTTMGKRVRVR
jgi:ribosomal protein L1